MLATVAVAMMASAPLELAPGTRYDPRIPTLQSVVGHDVGAEISTPDQIVAYLRALAAAASERTRLVEYARTWEGRPLHTLVIAAPERIARLDAVKADLRRLADPRGLAAGEADRLVRELPVVTWLIHAVHGNEISSSDAALAEAYHLLAAQGDAAVDTILRESIVLIDPLENPDGRARFLAQNLLGRAATADPEPVSAEHDEPWPGGRANHYLFDMNRDWFALSQPETVGRVGVHLDWYPHVVVDLHEMGGESTYYFAPPAEPENPHITVRQRAWFGTFGKANAERFDERGFAYFVKEVYDSFYPGYGESWPLFQGAVGMTYEQASARGLAYRRTDDTLLTYRQGIVQHFTAAITTAATAARNRERLLRDFHDYRKTAVAEGQGREYLIPPGVDPPRAARLARLLARQGLEVGEAEEPVKAGGRTFPPGTFVVPMAQPASRLLRNLLDPSVAMDPKFLDEQERRRRKRLSDEIYDITAWSLPLAFDVEVLAVDRPTGARTRRVDATAPQAVDLSAGPGGVLPALGRRHGGGSDGSAAGRHPRAERRRRLHPERTRVSRGNGDHPRGRERGGPARAAGSHPGPPCRGRRRRRLRLDRGRDLPGQPPCPRVETASRRPRVGRADPEHGRGVDALGPRAPLRPAGDCGPRGLAAPPRPRALRRPGPAVGRLQRRAERRAGAAPARLDPRRGHARHPRRRVALGGPHEGRIAGDPHRLKGGRPETDPSDKDKEKEKDAKPDDGKPFDLEKAIQPERERPEHLPGGLLRVELDREHWLSAGLDGELAALVEGQRIFTPIKLDQGVNVGVFAPLESLVVSGVVWPDARAQRARKAFLIHQPMGEGHIVAFAEEPNFRGYTEATALLFMNAVLLGPAH